jgi:Helix-turn-helix domain
MIWCESLPPPRIAPKALDVLQALLWRFHNAKSGLCFPSYETIAEAAGCARSTVAEAIKALEAGGVMTWVNRLKRVRDPLGGRARVLRTSNGYAFHDPKSSKSDERTRTESQASSPSFIPPALPEIDPETPLGGALLRYQTAFRTKLQPT